MLEYKYEETFIRLLLGNQEAKSPAVNEKNVSWHLFQFGRDISLTKGIYEQKLNMRRSIGHLPKSLQVAEDYHDSISEMRTFVFALDSFLRYIQSREKPMVVNIENTKTEMDNIEQQIKEAPNEIAKERHETKKQKILREHRIAHGGMVGFVKNLMPSGITVIGEQISVRSKDPDFIQFLQTECERTGYKYTKVLERENHNGTGLRERT